MFKVELSKHFFIDLHELHEDWLVKHTKFTPQAPVTIIDANCDLQDLTKTCSELQSGILKSALNL